MAGFLESALDAARELIEAGPVKIDNKLVEGLIGAGVVGIAGYTAYKVLNDKGAAENVATIISPQRSETEKYLESMGAQKFSDEQSRLSKLTDALLASHDSKQT